MDQEIVNLFVVEYSLEQQAYHISTLKQMLLNNLESVATRTSGSYFPLFITRSRDEAKEFARRLEQIIGRPSSQEELKNLWPEFLDLDDKK